MTASGKVRCTGRLGDGSGFSAGGTVLADERWPLHTRLYDGGGILAGSIAFTAATAPAIGTIDGTLTWQTPASTRGLYRSGFIANIAALRTRYRAPSGNLPAIAFPAGTTVTLAGGNLAAPLLRGRMEGTSMLPLHPRTYLVASSAGIPSWTLSQAPPIKLAGERLLAGVLPLFTLLLRRENTEPDVDADDEEISKRMESGAGAGGDHHGQQTSQCRGRARNAG